MLRAKINIAGAINKNILKNFNLLNYNISKNSRDYELTVWITNHKILLDLVNEFGDDKCKVKNVESINSKIKIRELQGNDLY